MPMIVPELSLELGAKIAFLGFVSYWLSKLVMLAMAQGLKSINDRKEKK